MADVRAAVAPLLEMLAPLFGQALRSFVATAAAMLVLALGLAGVSFSIAHAASLTAAMLAAGLALLVCVPLGALLAVKRAALSALLVATGGLGLGRRAVDLVFDKLLAVDASGAMGERGGAAARAVERLPLAQAEARLRAVVRGLVAADDGSPGARAWLRRGVQSLLLEKVESVTLAHLRDQDAAEGGVDLVKARAWLAENADAGVAALVRGARRKLTLAVVLAATAASVLGALVLRAYPPGV